WNDTGRDYPVATLPELVAAQAARTPEAPAVCVADRWLSCRQFGARVDALARVLRSRGGAAGDLVGVCLDRGLDLLVAVHAVVAAGAAYLPLEPDYPDARLEFMLADSGARLVLSSVEYAGRLSDVDRLVLAGGMADGTVVDDGTVAGDLAGEPLPTVPV